MTALDVASANRGVRAMRWTVAGGLMAFSLAAAAQTPPAAAPFDEAARRAVVTTAADYLRNRYVFPDTGESAAAKLEGQLAAGVYKNLTDRRAFADKVTADLHDVAKDKHLYVSAPGQPGAAAAASAPQIRAEAGVVRVDRLAGDIGYVQVVISPFLEQFVPAIERAMASLADSKAVILDLRQHAGGNAASAAYLGSFFVDPTKTVALNYIVSRRAGTKEFTSQPVRAVKTKTSLFDKTLYVLIGPQTRSAGEAVAYDLQALKLATFVGETTWGGANPGPTLPLGAQLTMSVPTGRAENPTTGGNWEGVGVIPDIAVPAADALRAALEKLGQTPASGDIDALSQARPFTPRSAQQPGSEAAVRRTIQEILTGQPNYELMGPTVQQTMRAGLASSTKVLTDLGELKDLKFREVGSDGRDVYDVAFARGAQVWSILLDQQGRTISVGIAPASSANRP